MLRCSTAFPLAAIIAVSTMPAAAQEAPTPLPSEDNRASDWTLAEVPEHKAVVAAIEFDNGISIATRCVNNVFDATIHGLPEAKGSSRTLRVTVGNESPYDTAWTVGQVRSSAFSRVPMRLARDLAKGGKLQIRVPGQGGRPATRYIMEVDQSGSAVEQTLAACGKSMVDLRYSTLGDESEEGLPANLEWASAPRPVFPAPVGNRSPTEAFVTVTCMSRATGAVEDCEVESEHPTGFKTGEAVLKATRRARLRSTVPGELIPSDRMIVFTTYFRMN